MNILVRDKEKQLVRLLHQGHPKAMDRLYSAYADYMAGVCARYISDPDTQKDVLQESFIRVLTQSDKFEYRGSGSLKGWLSRIVVNQALTQLKADAVRNGFYADTEPPDLPDEQPDVGGLDADVLTGMLQRLPAGYRAVFNLYAVEGKSHKQIAELLGIKADTSASQYHRARNMLARMIREYKQKT